MRKNGAFFFSATPRELLRPSVWDPFEYRSVSGGESLGDYASAGRAGEGTGSFSPYRPIEYRDIPDGDYSTFKLEGRLEGGRVGYPVLGERSLLFGTMRAYLGNVLVTPKAGWLGLDAPLSFHVKAEFAHVKPFDGLVYFWWAYLRSTSFLESLPIGGGGTRPRLRPEALLRTPVVVPDLEKRASIHSALEEHARAEWERSVAKARVLEDMTSACLPE